VLAALGADERLVSELPHLFVEKGMQFLLLLRDGGGPRLTLIRPPSLAGEKLRCAEL